LFANGRNNQEQRSGADLLVAAELTAGVTKLGSVADRKITVFKG
jgi:hypothetical protein